jgi:hypothetical protein
LIQHCGIRWPAVASESGNSGASYRTDGAVGRYLADPVRVRVGHINISLAIHGNSFGLTEEGLERRATVAYGVTAGNGLNRVWRCNGLVRRRERRHIHQPEQK